MLDYQLLDNENINTTPIVLTSTLFNIVQHKTDTQGYWKADNGKLYIDNIELIKYSAIETSFLNLKIKDLFRQGEKCVFYKNVYNHGVIAYPNGTTETLKNRTAIIEDRKPSKKYILALLDNNNGLTVYKINNGQYLIEIYK